MNGRLFLRRAGTTLLVIWIAASLVFLAIRLVPGDPAEMLASQGGVLPDPTVVAQLREKLGLDQSALMQYVNNLKALARGDLGVSLIDGAPVREEVFRRLPRTLELVGATAVMSLLLGLPLGLLCAYHAGGRLDMAVSAVAGAALAMPVFVIGTLLILVFSQALGWLPSGGYVAFSEDPLGHLARLAMPVIAIGLGLSATVLRITRTAVMDVLASEFVRTARAKGLGELPVMLRHVLRNALFPVITVLALNVGALLGGAVLVEYVFNWPGLSGLLVGSVNARDYPMVVGVVLVISTVFVLLNLAVDILFALLDPRVRA